MTSAESTPPPSSSENPITTPSTTTTTTPIPVPTDPPLTTHKIKHLCFSGGGLKGLAYIGAYKALQELNLLVPTQLESVTGTSVGAFFGFLLILGYSAEELYSFVTNFRYADVKDVNFLNFFQTWGIESGEKIVKFFQAFMRKKTGQSDLTFSEFYKKYPIKFTIVVTNLRTHTPVYFNHENTPNEYVIWTIRRSMSLPLFFNKICDPQTQDCWVDGGLLDNFAIQQCPDTEETLGIYCEKDGPEDNHSNSTLEDYFSNIFQSVLNLNTKYKLKTIKQAHLVRINIQKEYSNAYHTELDEPTKKSFYDAGYQAIVNHFATTTSKA